MRIAQVMTNQAAHNNIELAVGRAIKWGGDERALLNAWSHVPEGAKEILALERFCQRVENVRETEGGA